MIDKGATILALRARLLTLEIATTGTTSISATATGYNRAAGSFITDGFYEGAEVLVSGFADATLNGYKVLTGVTATDLAVRGGNSTTEAASGDEEIVWGLPETRAWELVETSPSPARPHIEEEFVPGPSRLRSYPANGGTLEERAMYFLRWFAIPGYDVIGIHKAVQAVEALFTPGTAVTDGTNAVRVRSDVSTRASNPLPLTNSKAVVTIEVPLWAESVNAVAA